MTGDIIVSIIKDMGSQYEIEFHNMKPNGVRFLRQSQKPRNKQIRRMKR